MASRTEVQPRSCLLAGFLACGAAIGISSLAGCAAFYPELSTPIRGAVSEDRYDPPPPKDVLFVALSAARIPPKTRDGRSWDQTGGAAPDAYAVLFVDEKEAFRTVVVPNNLKPKWPNPDPVNLRIARSAKVRVEVWDDNALVSHPICNQGIHDLHDAAAVGTLEVECDSGAAVILTVQPPKARLGIGLYYERQGKRAVVSRTVAESAAGRAGLKPGDEILTIDGEFIEQMGAGELEAIIRSKSKNGFIVEVRGADSKVRKIQLQDEPMYPIKGEGIELLGVSQADVKDD